MEKILVTPRSFGQGNDGPLRLLEGAGYQVMLNPLERILTEEEMGEYIRDAVGVILGVDPLTGAVLERAPRLRAIAMYGTGMDNVDLARAGALGIPVSNTRGANSEAVADYAFAMMLACARRLVEINCNCHQRDWRKITSIDVYGKTLGVLGMGAIGRGVIRRAGGFAMKTLAYDLYWDEDFARDCAVEWAQPERIFAEADFITLHLPLNDDTRGLVNAAAFAMMKPNAILINTARGGLVDEGALVEALATGRIYGAGVDVFAQEPPENEKLYQLPNLLMGSHCAASSEGAVYAMGMRAAENLLADLEG